MSEIRLPSMNRVMITGRLTADPNLNFTPDGVPVLKFRIASTRVYKDKSGSWKEIVAFIPVCIWRDQAERLAEVLHKGSPVFVEGSLQSSSWEIEGQKKSMIEINAFRIQNLERISMEEKETMEKEAEEKIPETENKPPEDDLPF